MSPHILNETTLDPFPNHVLYTFGIKHDISNPFICVVLLCPFHKLPQLHSFHS